MGASSGWSLVSRAAPRRAETTGDARVASAAVTELRAARETRRTTGVRSPSKRRRPPAA